MDIKKVWGLYFSATGTTSKAVKTISEKIAEQLGVPVELISFTRPLEREREFYFTDEDLVVVGTPTYAGKMPNKILPDFQKRLRGNGALAVSLVMFGNRGYENSLAELCSTLVTNGFGVIAAGAFVGEHAFTNELGYGRPGWSDQFEMKELATKIADKVKSLTGAPEAVQVPGAADAPYYVPKGMDGKAVDFLKAKPKTHLSKCNNCGACARICPMGAIDLKDYSRVSGTCIKCQACVHKCTKRAKYFDDPAFLSHVAMLERNHTQPCENEWFL